MGRYLHVNDKKLPLLDNTAEKLIADGILYPCGDGHGHDLHLDPRPLLLSDSERLAVAIAEGMAAFTTGLAGEAIDHAVKEVRGLPVAGYKPTQSQDAIDLVNEGKQLEERVIRYLEEVARRYGPAGQGVDLMFARGNIEDGFSRVFKKVFQPNGSRIALPEDDLTDI